MIVLYREGDLFGGGASHERHYGHRPERNMPRGAEEKVEQRREEGSVKTVDGGKLGQHSIRHALWKERRIVTMVKNSLNKMRTSNPTKDIKRTDERSGTRERNKQRGENKRVSEWPSNRVPITRCAVTTSV